MTRSDIQKVLTTAYPAELVDSMLTSYENALAEYKKEGEKHSFLDNFEE